MKELTAEQIETIRERIEKPVPPDVLNVKLLNYLHLTQLELIELGLELTRKLVDTVKKSKYKKSFQGGIRTLTNLKHKLNREDELTFEDMKLVGMITMSAIYYFEG